MRNLRPLSSRESRHIIELVNEQYGCDIRLDYYLIIHERDRNIFIVSREVAQIDLEALRVNSLGSYFCEQNDDATAVRLSIEGSQLVGPLATKNTLTLADDEYKLWAKGTELKLTPELQERLKETQGYLLIKNSRADFYGTARAKNDALLNFTPKNRRIAHDA